MAEQLAANAAQAELDEEEFTVATQWQLMWWRFRKHKPAVISGLVLAFFYLLFPFAEFLGTGDPAEIAESYHLLRPQAIRFFDEGSFRPHVNGLEPYRDQRTFQRKYEVLEDVKIDVGFFTKGFQYRFLGFIDTDRHLIGFTGRGHGSGRNEPRVLRRPSIPLSLGERLRGAGCLVALDAGEPHIAFHRASRGGDHVRLWSHHGRGLGVLRRMG